MKEIRVKMTSSRSRALLEMAKKSSTNTTVLTKQDILDADIVLLDSSQNLEELVSIQDQYTDKNVPHIVVQEEETVINEICS